VLLGAMPPVHMEGTMPVSMCIWEVICQLADVVFVCVGAGGWDACACVYTCVNMYVRA
jgi:hypothetical protein